MFLMHMIYGVADNLLSLCGLMPAHFFLHYLRPGMFFLEKTAVWHVDENQMESGWAICVPKCKKACDTWGLLAE